MPVPTPPPSSGPSESLREKTPLDWMSPAPDLPTIIATDLCNDDTVRQRFIRDPEDMFVLHGIVQEVALAALKAVPAPPSSGAGAGVTVSDEMVRIVARAIASAYGEAYPLANLPDTRFVSAGEYEKRQEIDQGREDAARAVLALPLARSPGSADGEARFVRQRARDGDGWYVYDSHLDEFIDWHSTQEEAQKNCDRRNALTPSPAQTAPDAGWRLPEGYVLVLEEPSQEQLEAGEEARKERTDVYLCGDEVAHGDMVEHVYRAMIAASPLSAGAPDAGWRPISEAPKDGIFVQTWNGRRQHVARFDRIKDAWVASFSTVTRRMKVEPPPTHFRPLPAGPSETDGGRT